MVKQDLINETAERTGFARSDVEIMFDGLFDAMREALANGDDVKIRQFGTFTVKAFDAREGRNPNTGEVITIPARKRIRFKGSRAIEDAMN